MWNYKCDRCGCALDPGERCDCGEAPADNKEVYTEDTVDGKLAAGGVEMTTHTHPGDSGGTTGGPQ